MQSERPARIIGHPTVIIVGSQAILGSYDEQALPADTTMSREVDVLPIGDDPAHTIALADAIEGVVGEWSIFEERHGFSIDGVDTTTAVLPDGWRSRLVMVSNENTAAPSGSLRFTGWCLDKEDLCVAKLCALREKDQRFVAALLGAGFVDRSIIADRLRTLPDQHDRAARRALAWLGMSG